MTLRIRKLSRPGLQLRLVGAFLGMASLGLLLQFLLLGGRLTSILAKLPRYGGDIAQDVPSMLLSVLLVSAIVVLPLIFALGVVMTHKIAGPVYRFEEYLGQIARGEKVGPCRIRKGDELQELCNRLNSAIARLRSEAQQREGFSSPNDVDLAGTVSAPLPSGDASMDAKDAARSSLVDQSASKGDGSPADHSA